VRGLGVRVALWDVDTRDWTRPGVKKIVRRGTKGVKKGSIILMHDGGVDRRQTIAALPQIIAKFKERGYVFVTLQELANAD
jgi:peptidoglycan-N-acetylglucosamine deacetylase